MQVLRTGVLLPYGDFVQYTYYFKVNTLLTYMKHVDGW